MTRRPLVVIVEDDEWLAEQHARSLEAAGFMTDTSAHALEAIETIDAKRPDALVLDVFLAGPNAFTLLHELRSHADLATIPVILCTNSADSIAEEDVAGYGVKIVLDKATIMPTDLVAAVKKALL